MLFVLHFVVNCIYSEKNKSAKGHPMTYIKLLTVLTTLALLTACGGAAAPADKAGGDTNTGGVTDAGGDAKTRGVNTTTDCTATPFNTNCDAVESAITSRQTMCFTSVTANPRCGVVIEGACMANPFRAETACMADTYLSARIAECIKGGLGDDDKCKTITADTEKNTMITSCLKNPFDIVCTMTVADFATHTATARMNRLDFCNDNANVADNFCTANDVVNNVVIICSVDPFNAICFTDDTYLSDRAEDCIMAGNAGESKCNNLFTESASNTCLTNPFADACASNTDFMTYAVMARTNRLTFCNDSDNVANTLCMGASQMAICGSNPFNASCFADATYLPARVNNCITGGNAGEARCNAIFTATAINDCLTNPFSDACSVANGAFTTYAEDARDNRDTFCETNPSDALCDTLNLCNANPFATACGAYFQNARTTICGGTVFANCVNVGDLPEYPTKPNKLTGSGFVTGTETGLNTTDIHFEGSAASIISIPLFIGRRGGADSTNPDSFAYFATGSSSAPIYYVGILPTTNLGAPLPSTTANAVWAGHFSTGTITNTAVNFFVNFSTGRFGFSNAGGDGFGTQTIEINSLVSLNVTLNAVFGEHDDADGFNAGRMGGTIDVGTNMNIPVIGLIGAEGAVGVFTEEGQQNAITGGFTATNPN